MESPKAFFYDGCCWVDDDLLWAFRDIVVGTYVVRCLLAHVCVSQEELYLLLNCCPRVLWHQILVHPWLLLCSYYTSVVERA